MAALGGLIAGVPALLKSCESAGLIGPGVQTGAASPAGPEALPDCRALKVLISAPANGYPVTRPFPVVGSSTPDPRCRYVYLIAEDANPAGGRRWTVIDNRPVAPDGTWSATADLRQVAVGSAATLTAYVTADPESYRAGDRLGHPPRFGAMSNPVNVERKR